MYATLGWISWKSMHFSWKDDAPLWILWCQIERAAHLRLRLGNLLHLHAIHDSKTWNAISLEMHQVRVITVFTVFRLLPDFVCLLTYEFWLSLCKIVRSSVILLLPLSVHTNKWVLHIALCVDIISFHLEFPFEFIWIFQNIKNKRYQDFSLE
jgi:hypothetical protein